MVSLEFFIDSGLILALGANSDSDRNEYQGYFLVVKVASVQGWQSYHIHVLNALKSGSLSLLEPSGPLQSLTGIALPYQLLFFPVTLHDCEIRSLDYRENIKNTWIKQSKQLNLNDKNVTLLSILQMAEMGNIRNVNKILAWKHLRKWQCGKMEWWEGNATGSLRK
jgi:hypothetical protein